MTRFVLAVTVLVCLLTGASAGASGTRTPLTSAAPRSGVTPATRCESDLLRGDGTVIRHFYRCTRLRVTSDFRVGDGYAICTFPNYLRAAPLSPYLRCSKMREAATVLLQKSGRPLFRPWRFSVNGFGPYTRDARPLRLGETWWGNERGRDGRGLSRGRVLYRCVSRVRGLTCRSISGHGF